MKKCLEKLDEKLDNKLNLIKNDNPYDNSYHDYVKTILEDELVDIKTKNFLSSIKNPAFVENTFDLEKKLFVNSIYLNKITKIGRSMSTMIWQFYRHRGKLSVNKVIKQYGRENLTINYKIFQ
jgi:hypothetical protein